MNEKQNSSVYIDLVSDRFDLKLDTVSRSYWSSDGNALILGREKNKSSDCCSIFVLKISDREWLKYHLSKGSQVRLWFYRHNGQNYFKCAEVLKTYDMSGPIRSA